MCFGRHWHSNVLVTCNNTIAIRTKKGIQLYEYTSAERLVAGRFIDLSNHCLHVWTLTNDTIVWLDDETEEHGTIANFYRLHLNTLQIDKQDCSLKIMQHISDRTKKEASLFI